MRSTYTIRPALKASARLDCVHVTRDNPEPCKDCLWWAGRRAWAFLEEVPPEFLRMKREDMELGLRQAVCDG
jgi:hypothetical protein